MPEFDPNAKTAMHPLWGSVWASWFFIWVFMEVTLQSLPDIWILYWFLLFMPFEMQGALRVRWEGDPGQKRKLGDTLSEFVWTFIQGGTSRQNVGRCLAIALGIRFISLLTLFDDGGHWVFPGIYEGGALGIAGLPWWANLPFYWLPVVFVGMGVIQWLYEHFPERGRTG